MASKKSSAAKKRRAIDNVPETEPHCPLNGQPWYGHDNAEWVDLAVDSRNANVVLWLRKRVKNRKYFLITACVGGHFLKKEVTEEEARYLYHQLPDRAGYVMSFPESEKSVTKTKNVAKKTR